VPHDPIAVRARRCRVAIAGLRFGITMARPNRSRKFHDRSERGAVTQMHVPVIGRRSFRVLMGVRPRVRA